MALINRGTEDACNIFRDTFKRKNVKVESLPVTHETSRAKISPCTYERADSFINIRKGEVSGTPKTAKT